MTRWILTLCAACLASGIGRGLQAQQEKPARDAPQYSSRSLKPKRTCTRMNPQTMGPVPLWCQGSTSLVRTGDRAFASGIETLKGAAPLNNVRWLLFERKAEGWKQILADEAGRTREPCPMACFDDGRFFLSVNPTLVTAPEAHSGPARPEILQFKASEPGSAL